MPWIVKTQKTGATFGEVGELWRSRPNLGHMPQHNQIATPNGFNPSGGHGMAVTYRNRHYIVNIGSDNVMIDEHFRCNRIGIAPPIIVPVLAAGAGPGVTGRCLVALAFYDILTDEWSPLSGVSNAVDLTNQSRAITNVQTTAFDPRVSHVGVFASMDGDMFRLTTMRELGVSSITENVGTLARSLAMSTTFSRGPQATMCAIYHERFVTAGDTQSPDVLYVMAAFKPERWEGLSFRTRQGEPITALVPAQDVLLVFTPRSFYALRGFTDQDLSLDLVDPGLGAFSQLSCTGGYGEDAVFCNDQGIFLYNGNTHDLTKDNQNLWQKLYRKYVGTFDSAVAVRDPNELTYTLYLTGRWNSSELQDDWEIPDPDGVLADASISIGWTLGMRSVMPEITGTFDAPDLGFDVMARPVDYAAVLAYPGAKRGEVYFGDCTGTLRKKEFNEGAPGYADDDADPYGKRLWIRTPAYWIGEYGGDEREGKHFTRQWTYLESETTQWTLYMKAGYEKAYRQVLPDNLNYWWKDDVDASALLRTVNIGGFDFDLTYEPKTGHWHVPERVSGHVLTCEFTALSPTRFVWSGFGGQFEAGVAQRLPILQQFRE